MFKSKLSAFAALETSFISTSAESAILHTSITNISRLTVLFCFRSTASHRTAMALNSRTAVLFVLYISDRAAILAILRLTPQL